MLRTYVCMLGKCACNSDTSRIIGALRLKNFDVSHMFGYKLSIKISAQ